MAARRSPCATSAWRSWTEHAVCNLPAARRVCPRGNPRLAAPPAPADPTSAASAEADAALVRRVLAGETEAFEPLVVKYQARVFAAARRHARREDEVADIVQEVFLKAYERLAAFRGEAPFEHWLMRIATRTCLDFLRRHQRRREDAFTDLSDDERGWLERFRTAPDTAGEDAAAARALVGRLLDALAPKDRLVITLLEIEERPVKEIATLTGWSETLVKVRAFRARAAMRRALLRLHPAKYL